MFLVIENQDKTNRIIYRVGTYTGKQVALDSAGNVIMWIPKEVCRDMWAITSGKRWILCDTRIKAENIK